MIKRWLFKLARSRVSGYFIGYAFQYATHLMPLDRLLENEYIIVFRHPVPSWATHCLAVPKRRIPSLLVLDSQSLYVAEILCMLVQVAQEMSSYTILVNGGEYQDVPQLHFHLAEEKLERADPFHKPIVFEHLPPLPICNFESPQFLQALSTLIDTVQQTVHDQQLTAYSVLVYSDSAEKTLTFHLRGDSQRHQ